MRIGIGQCPHRNDAVQLYLSEAEDGLYRADLTAFYGRDLHVPLKILCVAILVLAGHFGGARKNNGE
jgi:hypothetical protein